MNARTAPPGTRRKPAPLAHLPARSGPEDAPPADAHPPLTSEPPLAGSAYTPLTSESPLVAESPLTSEPLS
ncbi:hypothetical protein [Streptomyces sp. NBC_00091]|uniref:hypothetical protein n=1 Tax=Streptomyces sp. NBC_00091 TaxID=2975648 RepID=UPI002254B538|nr:hypothetical protein [Streptomyces sp. NBC_00091]MCX5378320.1 hypothetical protein [Streptomyces sp. NBC_00091]